MSRYLTPALPAPRQAPGTDVELRAVLVFRRGLAFRRRLERYREMAERCK